MLTKFLFTAAFLLLIGGSLAGIVQSADENEEDDIRTTPGCNQVFDKFRERLITSYGEELDPHPLDETATSIPYNLVFTSGKISIRSYDGSIAGLKTLERNGDCKVTEKKDGTYRHVVPCKVKFLHAQYKTKLEAGGVSSPEVTISGSIGESSGRVLLKSDSEGSIEVESLEFPSMRNMKVKADGLGPLTWALNIVSEAFVSIFSMAFRGVFQSRIKAMMNEILAGKEFEEADNFF